MISIGQALKQHTFHTVCPAASKTPKIPNYPKNSLKLDNQLGYLYENKDA